MDEILLSILKVAGTLIVCSFCVGLWLFIGLAIKELRD